MRREPPTLPKGTPGGNKPSGSKKSNKKRIAAQVVVGLVIGVVIIAGIAAMRNSCTSEDMAMREAILADMRTRTVLMEAEHAKAESMIDLLKAYDAAGTLDSPQAIYTDSLLQSNLDRSKHLQSEFDELKERYESYERCD